MLRVQEGGGGGAVLAVGRHWGRGRRARVGGEEVWRRRRGVACSHRRVGWVLHSFSSLLCLQDRGRAIYDIHFVLSHALLGSKEKSVRIFFWEDAINNSSLFYGFALEREKETQPFRFLMINRNRMRKLKMAKRFLWKTFLQIYFSVIYPARQAIKFETLLNIKASADFDLYFRAKRRFFFSLYKKSS